MNNTNLDQTLADLNKIIKDLAEAAHQPVAQEITQFLEFRAKKGESNNGKGVIWSGEGPTKQLTFNHKPDRLFSSESIDLAKDKTISIGSTLVLDSETLGPSVAKSNLREVGRLKGLIVDGSVSINQYVFYNAALDRLGFGTDEPNAAVGIADQGVEVMIGTNDQMHGMIGTYASTDFDIVTGNVPRISVRSNGDVVFGNPTKSPCQVKVLGKLSVGVEVPDSTVDLHVAGPVRFNNKLHLSASSPPTQGNYSISDIVWNDNPTVGQCVGWICLRAGNPGMWYPFGEIKEQNK